MAPETTPIRKQYLEIKRQYPNAILFFRLGDFYETFDEDAEITARELDIVLTSRPIGKGIRSPLAGIPYHAVENYLARLVEKGYHVAICEQIGDAPTKGIFHREVVRVVTPGTIVEPTLLPGHSNNYLAAVITDGDRTGLAYTDITTGEFAVTEIITPDIHFIRAELARLSPAEILFPENQTILNGISSHLTPLPAWKFDPGKCRDTLQAHFETSTLDGFGLKDASLALRAAGSIVQYLKSTDSSVLKLLTSLRTYSMADFMVLDAPTRRNLELTETFGGNPRGSLLGVLDHTISPMGKRLIRQWINRPLLDIESIEQRLDGVDHFFRNPMLRAEFRLLLKPLADLERLANRIVSNHAQPRDLVALRETLGHIPTILDVFTKETTDAKTSPALSRFIANIDPSSAVLAMLNASITVDPPATTQNIGIIRSGFSADLDDVIEASSHARAWINNLEQSERQRTGIKTLKVGYNKVFGYFIEVTKANIDAVPSEYIRKQTLVNAERYITPEMKEYETLVLNAEGRIREIESRLFHEICSTIGNSVQQLSSTAGAIAVLDVIAAFAEAAALWNYVRPVIADDELMDIRSGRHPVVERSLHGERFTPNDIIFEKGDIVRIITGPNMSGKSTYLRQAAMIVLMAQIGSFVPAVSARIGLVDRIFTRIGAQDEIHSGQSTFMVEMIEAANILHHASPRSLLILDEIGRGTSTYDGVSIAWAVVEYIHNHSRLRSKTLFATHYHELTRLADLLPGVKNYNVAVTEADGKVVFLHTIIPGGADRSYGIHVAQLAGLPKPVVQRANDILKELEKSAGQAVQLNPESIRQIALFPETNPLLEELTSMDINSISPIEALGKLFEWQSKYAKKNSLTDNEG
ncbi:MAG: DNA mismatch repair protein MutS [Chloroflexota bacterium]